MGRNRDTAGFTLVELLLVTVILGLLASISAPYFAAAREKAWAAAVMSDVRNAITAVEMYVANENSWPSTIDQVESAGWTASQDTEVCLFIPVPATPYRGDYFILVAAHPASETVVWTAYPILDGRVNSFQRSGQRGCEGFSPPS